MATVIHVGGKKTPVKNLGWMMRTKKIMEGIIVTDNDLPNYDAILIVKYADGTIFYTDYADFRVLKNFLSRPKFKNVYLALTGKAKYVWPNI